MFKPAENPFDSEFDPETELPVLKPKDVLVEFPLL